jgi:Leucine-rich repeat (LRR) protein
VSISRKRTAQLRATVDTTYPKMSQNNKHNNGNQQRGASSSWKFNNYQQNHSSSLSSSHPTAGAGTRASTTQNNARPMQPPARSSPAPPPSSSARTTSSEKEGLHISRNRPTTTVNLESRNISITKAQQASRSPEPIVDDSPTKAQESQYRANRESSRAQKESQQHQTSSLSKGSGQRQAASSSGGGFNHRSRRSNNQSSTRPDTDEAVTALNGNTNYSNDHRGPDIDYETPGAVAIGRGVEIRRSVKGSLPSQPQGFTEQYGDLVPGEFQTSGGSVPLPNENNEPSPQEQPSQEADGGDDSAPEEDEKVGQRRKYYIGGAIILVVAIISGVVGGVVAGGGDSSSDTGGETDDEVVTPPPTIDTLKETRDMLRLKIQQLSPDPAVLDDVESPQYQALNWLASDFDETFGKDADLSGAVTSHRITNRYALATLYFATTVRERSWLFDLNFLSSDHECDWISNTGGDAGVVCGGDQANAEIVQLLLRNNILDGTIPDEIAGLSTLNVLDLSDNSLRGGIPAGISGLSELKELRLSENRLSESLPSELGSLSELSFLDLSGNQLGDTLPDSISQLSNLEVLFLERNSFSGSIDALTLLPSLRQLELAENQFSGPLPTNVGMWDKLKIFNVELNGFDGVLPPELLGLPRLQGILLSANSLTGTVPWSSIQGSLLDLHLRGNRFSGFLPGDAAFFGSRLRVLNLDGNELEGPLPENLDVMASSLQWLLLPGNKLSGTIPTSMGALTALKRLRLSSNKLTGQIPSELGLLTMLGKRIMLLDHAKKISCHIGTDLTTSFFS